MSVQFNASSLSDEYAGKSSLARYKELTRVFPNTLILFENKGYYYGFDETAVALNIWFGYPFRKAKGMLVAKGRPLKPLIRKFQLRGIRCILDEQGKVTFWPGKGFKLQKPLSYYEEHPISRPDPKPRNTSWTNSYTKQGGGWDDDAWVPGLPSSRFYKKGK